MNKNDALNTIINSHATPRLALEAIADYCDDPAAISSPTIIAAINDLLATNDEDDHDITLAAEKINDINPDLAREFAMITDLCPHHFCDPDNCA